MSKNEEYSYPVMGMVETDEKGEVTLPPEKSKDGKELLKVLEDPMKLPKADTYSFEVDGEEVHRISKKGIKYPSITRAEYERIKGDNKTEKDKEDEMEH